MRQLTPKKMLNTVFELDLRLLWREGVRGIIFDIDNTLESHRIPVPGEAVRAFISRVREAGFAICLISNGKRERVELFRAPLALPAISRAGKPRKKNLRRAMSIMNTSAKETALVGDQIFTDVYGGNRMGFYTVLVTPIERYETKLFYIKRFFERLVLNKIKE